MKRSKLEASATNDDDSIDVAATSGTSSPSTSAATATGGNMEPFVPGATTVMHHDDSDNEALIVDCESPLHGAESPSEYRITFCLLSLKFRQIYKNLQQLVENEKQQQQIILQMTTVMPTFMIHTYISSIYSRACCPLFGVCHRIRTRMPSACGRFFFKSFFLFFLFCCILALKAFLLEAPIHFTCLHQGNLLAAKKKFK